MMIPATINAISMTFGAVIALCKSDALNPNASTVL